MRGFLERVAELRDEEQMASVVIGARDPPPPRRQKTCLYCEKPFYAGKNQALQRYCSRACFFSDKMAARQAKQMHLPF